MRYLSVCSGIEAATVAWHPLGWKAVAYSEVEPFPCSLLKHHYPETPNWGDMTRWRDWPRETVDLLVGGTPCQSFSTAGLRKGLDDIRGQLALGFSQIAEHSRPRWIVWENVPGVLSSGGGRDFGSFIGSLVKLGYGLCWRVLDAQHFGVPQRRRRVFVVGYLGDWRNSAAVLFEQESLRGDFKAGRKKRKGTAGTTQDGIGASCQGRPINGMFWDGTQITQALDAVLEKRQTMPEKNRFPAVLVNQKKNWPAKIAPTLSASMGDKQGLENQHIFGGAGHFVSSIDGANGQAFCSGSLMRVRRLTPLECERLQGFPDGWTDVPHRGKAAPDGPRYKAIGNSMAVPVMRWIGNRIQMVEELMNDRK